jgi:hypothetical protein
VSDRPFVPDDFAVPDGLARDEFRLVPLGPQHNASDHAAWTSSIEHIRATPGFAGRSWPPPEGMTLAQNLGDLEQHARDFAARSGFTYTVLEPDRDEVLGCVYIYPARDGEHDADVRSWVRAGAAHLDAPLHAAVCAWLAEEWPFARFDYAPRSSR